MEKRGMYWDDLRKLIQRNSASGAEIAYYRDRHSDPHKITVFDRTLPKRKGVFHTGYSAEDHWRDSQVAVAAWFNGMIPMVGSEGVRENGKFVEEPYRGALALLAMLLDEGCLRRTDELRRIFADHRRTFPSPSPSQRNSSNV